MIDLAVVGGGIAGLSVARAAHTRATVVVCDDEPGASWLPTAICHPFPGRSARIEHGLDAYDQVRRALVGASVRSVDMVRPVAGLSDRLWITAGDSVEVAAEHGIAIDRLSPEDTARRFPFLGATHAVAYRPAMVVSPPRLLRDWQAELKAGGVGWAGKVHGLERCPDGWRLRLSTGSLEARRVVLCLGAGLADWFPELAVRRVAGEVVTVAAKLEYAVSGQGIYLAPRSDGMLCVGATRHPVDQALADDEVVDRLLAHPLSRSLQWTGRPELWRGVRVAVPTDRKPLIGRLPGRDGIYLCAAMGSKGFFWAPQAGCWLVDAMLDGREVPASFDPSRIGGSYRSPRIG